MIWRKCIGFVGKLTFVHESNYWVNDINCDQTHIDSILDIFYELSEPNNFNVRNFVVHHVNNIE